MIRYCRVFLSIVLFFIFVSSSSAQDSYQLWYKNPAKVWTDAIPIGNGKLGGMIYGEVSEDRIQFNEETLWTGGPRDVNRKGAYIYLDQIRRLLSEGKQKEAESLAQQQFMGLQSNAGDRSAWVEKMKMAKNYADPNFDDSTWKTIQVPHFDGWETVGLENIDGAIWFRTDFELPSSWSGKDLVLDLNRIRDQDFTYINGNLIANTDNTEPRKYTIPAKYLKVGKNSVCIFVLNYSDKGGLVGYKDPNRQIGIYPVNEVANQLISLAKYWKYKIADINPPSIPAYQASYQPFGDIMLHFKHDKSLPVKDYRRSLDLETAIAETQYTIGETRFKREYFASEPNRAIVVHLTANRLKSISLDVNLKTVHQEFKVEKKSNQSIALRVKVKNGVLFGEAILHAVVKNGSISIINNVIQILKADEVNLYLTAASNFVNSENVSGNPGLKNQGVIKEIQKQSYQSIKNTHLLNYKRYYDTFSIKLGEQKTSALPTDERLKQFATNVDPSFVALYLQYARYLLISSSRPGSQPANLQGIWNDLLSPPWGSKYTTNINLEMNYWPSEVLNLAPLNEPLFSKIAALSKTGTETARQYYNANGWVLHHNTDLWNATAPINNSNHGIWVTGGAWLSWHLWEHFRFSNDLKFLKNEAYPTMKKAALFFDDFLVKDKKTGWLISTPSNSPENGGLVAGPTMDHQLIRSLYQSCIEAAAILGVDAELRSKWGVTVKDIAPNQVGKHKQLQEWLTDIDDTTNKHRHVSHLWGVYPGNDITWSKNSTIMEAARQSLLYRGDDATGWSLAWKINFWARFKDGDHAMQFIKMLLKPATASTSGSYLNLFDAHPPFQIDGNFGAAAGIAELIIQSHESFIELLPALPTSFADGEVKGIRARGGFELDMKWTGGNLKELSIKNERGGVCNLKYKGKSLQLNAKAGQIYRFNGNLQ